MIDTDSKIFSGFTLSKIVLILFLCLFLFLPSGFSTNDAWNYAANIKYSGEIFYPYHLLYNALGYVFCYLPGKAGADILGCLKVMNAFFAVLAILFVQLIMRRLGKGELVVIIVSCLTGASFSVIRYATENETYIIPLSLALIGSYFYLLYINSGNGKYAALSGLWATLSVLFHLTYIFWWLSLLIGIVLEKKRRASLWYLLVSLSAPLIYLMVILSVSGSLDRASVTAFIFDDFKRNVHFELSRSGLFFSAANLVRSFIQIHGYMLNMIRQHLLLIIPGIISLVFFTGALFVLPSRIQHSNTKFASMLFLVIILMFLFALFSEGNAEFIVMIPALSFIIIPILFTGCDKFLILIMSGMIIWNISYGIIPMHISSYGPEKYLCDKSYFEKNDLIIASDDQLLINMIYYNTGERNINNIYKSPARMLKKGIDIKGLESSIDSALIRGDVVYTDCVGPGTISRASISEGRTNKDFFNKYEIVKVRTWNTILGKKIISKITGKRKSLS